MGRVTARDPQGVRRVDAGVAAATVLLQLPQGRRVAAAADRHRPAGVWSCIGRRTAAVLPSWARRHPSPIGCVALAQLAAAVARCAPLCMRAWRSLNYVIRVIRPLRYVTVSVYMALNQLDIDEASHVRHFVCMGYYVMWRLMQT